MERDRASRGIPQGRSPACDNVEYVRRPSKGDPKCINIEKNGHFFGAFVGGITVGVTAWSHCIVLLVNSYKQCMVGRSAIPQASVLQ